MTRVLVLGANGFVGRHLVTALAQDGSLAPVAMVRSALSGSPEGIEIRRGDATDPKSLPVLLDGITHAVNCIAGSPAAMIAATRNLCDAVRATGPAVRVVHLSSMAVYGAATGLVDESRALDESAGEYGRAKVACERLVEQFTAEGGDAVILRPGCIHGPGSPQWTTRIARLLQAHRIGDLGPAGDGGCNLTFIADMVQAVISALSRPNARGQAFNVSDPDPGTWNDYFLHLGRAIGAVPVSRVSPRWLKLETKLLAPPLKIAEIAAGRLHLKLLLPEPLPPSLARSWTQDIVLDHRRADVGLGFLRTDPRQAITEAAKWFRATG